MTRDFFFSATRGGVIDRYILGADNIFTNNYCRTIILYHILIKIYIVVERERSYCCAVKGGRRPRALTHTHTHTRASCNSVGVVSVAVRGVEVAAVAECFWCCQASWQMLKRRFDRWFIIMFWSQRDVAPGLSVLICHCRHRRHYSMCRRRRRHYYYNDDYYYYYYYYF